MNDHATLRRMCAAQADIPSADVLALLDELELLAEDHDDLSRTLAYRENQLTAANAAVRGYRERAERAEALLASHARPVASGDARSPGNALGDAPARDRAATGIVTTAHLREDGGMTDWTTARVVRDRDGDLWGNDGSSAYWDYVGTCGFSGGFPASLVAADGDPTPVLDADSLPVVRTVGDLSARHLGREVHVEGMRRAVLLAMRQPLPDEPLVALLVRVYGDITSTDYLTLNTTCEVLS